MTHPDQLKGKTRDELKAIAKSLKIEVHPRAKEETIARQIMQQPNAYVQRSLNPTAHTAEKPVQITHNNTPEEVLEAIKEYTAKPDFVAEFPGDGTWIFKCRGCEESGNLAIPMKRIKVRAEFVSKGKRSLMSMGRDGSYKGYADTIISG